MSQAREPLPPGPEGPEHRAADETSPLISLPLEKCEKESTTLNGRELQQPSMNRSTTTETQDQSVWGDHTYGDLIKTQPQRLPKPNGSVSEQSPEETAKIQNGHAGLSNGNSIHNGVKHGTTDHRKLSAPVSQKMHRKLQSSLSVSSDGSKKSRESSTYSEAVASPEDCCVHCILACLFCEFLTLCNLVLGQASCGVCTSEACCCCCGEEMGDDCNCPCDMDCGIMDACCESSDCLEICMECCGICFPTWDSSSSILLKTGIYFYFVVFLKERVKIFFSSFRIVALWSLPLWLKRIFIFRSYCTIHCSLGNLY